MNYSVPLANLPGNKSILRSEVLSALESDYADNRPTSSWTLRKHRLAPKGILTRAC